MLVRAMEGRMGNAAHAALGTVANAKMKVLEDPPHGGAERRSSTFAILTIATAALATACSGAGAGEQPESGTFESDLAGVTPVLVEPRVLNEFDAGTDHIKFISAAADGEAPTLLVEFSRSGFYSEGTLDLLLRQQPDLTPLEIFYALAPEGEAPSSTLIEAHDRQSALRGNDVARRVAFDVDQPIEKSAAGCNTYFRSSEDAVQVGSDIASANIAVLNNRSGATPALCPATNFAADCFTQTEFLVLVVACLDSADLQGLRPWWKRQSGAWQTLSVPASQLGPNVQTGWYLPDSEPPLPGQFFPPQHIMAIEATSGGLYHLRAGKKTCCS
jgi:hypothetical protein